MAQNPFIEFKDEFPNSTPLSVVGEYTYKRLPYELAKCYTPLPKTVEPIIEYDYLQDRDIPYSTEDAYEVKREYRDQFNEAMQELGLNQEQQVQPDETPLYPQIVPPPLQNGLQTPTLNGVIVDPERTPEGGKRRSKKSKRKSRKSKRKSRKSKRKSRKYRKH